MSKVEAGGVKHEASAHKSTAWSSGAILFLTIFLVFLTTAGCGLKSERGSSVPAEVESVVSTVGDDISQERYEKIYNESSDLWKRDATLEQSTEVFKTLRSKLGKVESRSLQSASEENNSGGALKGHAFIVTYQTKFERGEGMERFTLTEENGHWRLARYLATSTALK